MNTDTRQPVLFVSHGAPLLAVQENAATAAWREIGRSLATPRAVLVASAHHDTPGPALTAHPRPQTIHDFHGFPSALYDIRYPALGEPVVAGEIRERLASAGFAAHLDAQRGLDHGVWVPLLHLLPLAEVPVIPLSMPSNLQPDQAFALGRAVRG